MGLAIISIVAVLIGGYFLWLENLKKTLQKKISKMQIWDIQKRYAQLVIEDYLEAHSTRRTLEISLLKLEAERRGYRI